MVGESTARTTGGGATAIDQSHLRRSLRLPHATALVVGTIIGATIFVQASEVTALVPHIPLVLLTWIVSGVITLFGALVCAELASAFPRTGGIYVFLKESFGPWLGFLWGWSMFWIMHSGIIAVLATVFARYATVFVPLGDGGTRAVAVGVILIISGINYFGVKFGSTVQTALTAGKLLAVVLLVTLGFALGSHLPGHFQ
jgi:APA family basic amino acid/polyamine antiporter